MHLTKDIKLMLKIKKYQWDIINACNTNIADKSYS